MADCELNHQQRTALSYVRAGISVFPVGPNKVPRGPWKHRQERLPSEEEVITDFATPAGIGRVCGAVSGNHVTIDLDVRDSADLADLDRCFRDNVNDSLGYDLVGNLTRIETPGPGIQYAYRCEAPVGGNQKLARHNGVLDPITGEYSNPGYMIETRGEGGYCLCPGSADLAHPKGGSNYRHVSGPPLEEMPILVMEEHDTLMANAKWLGIDGNPFVSPEAMAAHAEKPPTVSVTHLPARSESDILISWDDTLRPHGFIQASVVDGVKYWRRQGSTNPHSASTNYGGSDLFYAWSPNCHPALEPGRPYNKLAVYAALNFGDVSTESLSKAGRELHQRGYRRTRDLSHIDISEALGNPVAEDKSEPQDNFYDFETFEDFMSLQESTEYLCEDIIAKNQGAIIGGPQKSLKTGLSIDLGYSMATGTPFLGRFPCRRAVRVGMITGESGRAKIQRLLRTRADAHIEFLDGPPPKPSLYITGKLPDLSNAEHLRYIEESVKHFGLEALFIDPMYLCSGDAADHTANVAKMGNLLRGIDSVTTAIGCTPILLHHTNRKGEPGQPLTLRDLSGAGFAEWARQWLLVCPRSAFDPDTHQHKLWLVTGGSAGHAGKYAVDVREKDDSGDWAWIVDVRSEGDEKHQYAEEKAQRKEHAEEQKRLAFVRNIRTALNTLANNGGCTLNELRDHFQANDMEGKSRIKTTLIQDYIDAGWVRTDKATRGNGQKITVYLPSGEWVDISSMTACNTELSEAV